MEILLTGSIGEEIAWRAEAFALQIWKSIEKERVNGNQVLLGRGCYQGLIVVV